MTSPYIYFENGVRIGFQPERISYEDGREQVIFEGREVPVEDEMKMVPIADSTNVKAAGYDKETKELRLEFLSGGLYSYAGVSPETHDALMKSKSKGAYVAAHIRGKHAHRRVDQPPG